MSVCLCPLAQILGQSLPSETYQQTHIAGDMSSDPRARQPACESCLSHFLAVSCDQVTCSVRASISLPIKWG